MIHHLSIFNWKIQNYTSDYGLARDNAKKVYKKKDSIFSFAHTGIW